MRHYKFTILMEENVINHTTAKSFVSDDLGATVNGGIGDGKNSGGPAYCIETKSE